MKKLFGITIIALCAVALLASCDNLLTGAKADSTKGASLELVFALPSARTLLPTSEDLGDLIASYAVRMSRQGFSDLVASSSTSPTAENKSLVMNDVAPGEWKVIVSALDSDDEVVASGSEIVNVAAGESKTTATIILKYDQMNGSGELNITILFPADLGIDSVVATLSTSSTRVALPAAILPAPDGMRQVVLSGTRIKAGAPLLTLSFMRDGVELCVMKESLWILKNIATRATRTLSNSDFGAPPSGPKNVAMTAKQGAIEVSWTATSNFADDYRIERGLGASGPFVPVASELGPVARGWTDTNAPPNGTYYYRVAAVNRFGRSEWALGGITVRSSLAILGKAIDEESGTSNHVYWKNGTLHKLEAPSEYIPYATGIAVKGEDVYVSGYLEKNEGDTFAVYWKNGNLVRLEPSGASTLMATDIAVSGSDILICGENNYFDTNAQSWFVIPLFWENGILSELERGSYASYTCSKMILSGDDVLISGIAYTTDTVAVYWKNGVLAEFADILPLQEPTGIAVSGNNVFVTGNAEAEEVSINPYLGADGETVPPEMRALSTGYASNALVFDIVFAGADRYIVGGVMSQESGFNPVYWKNDGPPVPLGLDGALIGFATSVISHNGMVAIGGWAIDYNGTTKAMLWEDGVSYVLWEKAEPSSIQIAMDFELTTSNYQGIPGSAIHLDEAYILPKVELFGIDTEVWESDNLSVSTNVDGLESYAICLDGDFDTPLVTGTGDLAAVQLSFLGMGLGADTWHTLTLVVTKNGLSLSGNAVFHFMGGY